MDGVSNGRSTVTMIMHISNELLDRETRLFSQKSESSVERQRRANAFITCNSEIIHSAKLSKENILKRAQNK